MNALLQLVEAIELFPGDEPGSSSCPVSKQGHKQPLPQELTNTLLKASASKTASAARWHQVRAEALVQDLVRTEKLGQILSLRGAPRPPLTSRPTLPLSLQLLTRNSTRQGKTSPGQAHRGLSEQQTARQTAQAPQIRTHARGKLRCSQRGDTRRSSASLTGRAKAGPP